MKYWRKTNKLVVGLIENTNVWYYTNYIFLWEFTHLFYMYFLEHVFKQNTNQFPYWK